VSERDEKDSDYARAVSKSCDMRREFGETLTARTQVEARALLADHPDQIVVLRRGQARAVLFMCPDGCGDLLTINVDPEAGRAWRLREESDRNLTLMPSVWRTSGCNAHFVVWRSQVWWCRAVDESSLAEGEDSVLVDFPDWPREMALEIRNEWRRLRTEGRKTR
jgi:hypothetical protein